MLEADHQTSAGATRGACQVLGKDFSAVFFARANRTYHIYASIPQEPFTFIRPLRVLSRDLYPVVPLYIWLKGRSLYGAVGHVRHSSQLGWSTAAELCFTQASAFLVAGKNLTSTNLRVLARAPGTDSSLSIVACQLQTLAPPMQRSTHPCYSVLSNDFSTSATTSQQGQGPEAGAQAAAASTCVS